MWSILFAAELADRDTLIAHLWEKGTSGVIEEAAGLRAFFEDVVHPESICAAIKARASGFRHENEFNSSRVPHERWDPILAGERFFITPPCYRGKVPTGRLHLPIETTNAFGTGRHESTQLVLEALETYLAPSDTVLDVGCGSGILCNEFRADIPRGLGFTKPNLWNRRFRLVARRLIAAVLYANTTESGSISTNFNRISSDGQHRHVLSFGRESAITALPTRIPSG